MSCRFDVNGGRARALSNHSVIIQGFLMCPAGIDIDDGRVTTLSNHIIQGFLMCPAGIDIDDSRVTAL